MGIDYGIVAEAKRVAEKQAVTIGFASHSAKLDEKTWDAVSVKPVAKGEIVGCGVYDRDIGKWYGPDDFPVSIPLDHAVHGSATGENTGTEKQSMTLTVELIDPDGTSRGKNSSTSTIGPGNTLSVPTTVVTLDKAGAWELHAILEGEVYS